MGCFYRDREELMAQQAYTGGGVTAEALIATSPGCGVISALKHRRSTTVQVVGDSTGDDKQSQTLLLEWFGRLGANIAARHPGKNFLLRQWNDASQFYDQPISVQLGSDGERFAAMSSGCLRYSAPSVTTGLTVTARVRPTSWTASGTFVLAAKYDTTGNQRGWQVGITTNGTLIFVASQDGIAVTTYTSTAVAPFAATAAGWVRYTYNGTNVVFSTSTDGVTFTQLGTTVAVTQTALFDNATIPYTLGSYLVGSTVTFPWAGDIGWVDIRGPGGNTLAPPMPEDWDQASSSVTNTVLLSGGSNVLLLNGSQSGQNISYFDDPTRRPKLMAPHGQDLILLNDGHNESGALLGAPWIALYSAWVANIKTLLPGVPIACLAQNPAYVPSAANNIFSLTPNQIANRSARGASLMTWANTQPGVWGLDVWNAFTALDSQLQFDGLHPTRDGSQVWADYVDAAVFMGAA